MKVLSIPKRRYIFSGIIMRHQTLNCNVTVCNPVEEETNTTIQNQVNKYKGLRNVAKDYILYSFLD